MAFGPSLAEQFERKPFLLLGSQRDFEIYTCMYSMDSLDTFMATASYAVENMWNLQKQKSELKIFSQIFMLYPMFEWDSAH